MLENPDLKFTVAIAKKNVYEIEVTAQESPENRWKREQIRHFVDPAAFYGLHSEINSEPSVRTVVLLSERSAPFKKDAVCKPLYIIYFTGIFMADKLSGLRIRFTLFASVCC